MTPKEKAKDARLRREYHITLRKFNAVWVWQGETCYICKRAKTLDGKPLRIAVDHDHITGQVRGLLCWDCNKAIATLKDSPGRAYSAYQYLAKPPFEEVYGKIYTAPGKVGTKKRAKLLKAMRSKREYVSK